MHPYEVPYSITNNNTSSHDNDSTTNRLEKILHGISIETIEAEAIIYLAIYYHENDDYDNAAMYVYYIYILYIYIYRSFVILFLVQHLSVSVDCFNTIPFKDFARVY
jgi:hypothetical protein